MVVITPTITTADPHKYREHLEKISTFSEGVHLDFADGIFAPTELLPLEEAWRSDDLITHAHIMYQKPLDVIDDIINLEADLVILHAESDDVKKCLELLIDNGTRTGIAMLPETSVIDLFDHVLVFGGNLGHQGGTADLDQLKKVERLKTAYPDVELAWDGGVNDKNIKQIKDAGISVINVGGFIKNSHYPKNAYDTLVSLVS